MRCGNAVPLNPVECGMDLEKQIVLRVKGLIRVRNVRCLRSIFCVLRLPSWCSSVSI